MRKILFQLLVAVAASAILALALANGAKAREMIPFAGNYYPGTIVIKTKQRRLYYVLGQRLRDPLSSRRRPGRASNTGGRLLYRRQICRVAPGAAAGDASRPRAKTCASFPAARRKTSWALQRRR